ncbi:MAG TPA: LON peptidase substrate-binding domain-containing protein [Woeseiaceae bacterium]|nr:LON peptidase substrate-binding domain-containing protein [Woeseiaceae bacterium]
MHIPLFPLNTVLFPGGPLPLRIFEARYIDMISERLRADAPFGVVLIREGRETGPAATYDVGTLARITDWYQGSDGLLGVTAVGEQRFRVRTAECRHDGLNVGEVDLLPDESPVALPESHRGLADIVAAVLDDLGRLYESLERRYDDAGWVTWRLIEVLPLELAQKQACLERSTVEERLELVSQVLEAVRKPA